MNIGFKCILHPTPQKIKSIADAILWGMSAGGLTAAFADYPKVGIFLAILGTLAKCISNFFSED